MKPPPASSLVSGLFSFLLWIFVLQIRLTGAVTSINACTDPQCVYSPREPQVGPPTGYCQKILTPNTLSVSIQSLDDGCTVTIYSDPDCTAANMLEIDVGDCGFFNGTYIRSFSVDECPPGTPDPTLNNPTNTSTTLQSSTSTASGTIASKTESSSPTASTTRTAAATTTVTAAASTSNKTAIIAGAVGGGVGLLAITGSIFFFLLRLHRKRRLADMDPPPDHHAYPGQGGVELEAHGMYPPPHTGASAVYGDRMKASSSKRLAASGGSVFENHAAVEELPAESYTPRQELEAPMPPGFGIQAEQDNGRYSRERLPDMPRLPGPYQ
ncbi:hypothetical protein TWF696_007393 [Orbilia brochopaga]|uniref:Uncharacterized protein n=1 Tax=Orbilia brochopaga TaxID=3140254 RepID=A0AAV9UTA0_9PEZI